MRKDEVKNSYVYSSTVRKGIGKNGLRALNSAKDMDEVIEKFAQPNTRYKSQHQQRAEYWTLRQGKPLCSHFRGLVNPPKLNISQSTLDKIKKQ